jgi:hypothetical protein
VLSECLPDRLEEALHWAEKGYLLDPLHLNKDLSVQYHELKLSWADKCKEKNLQDNVVPAASKFADLMKSGKADAKSQQEQSFDKSSGPALNENMFAEIMKEMSTGDGKGVSNISTSAGISMIDNLKTRLAELLLRREEGVMEEAISGGTSAGSGLAVRGERDVLSNHDMFLAAVLEVLEGDGDTRVYFRTSGALAQLLALLRSGLTAIKEAKEDNRKADFEALGKHMKLLAVALSSERSSKLQLLTSDVQFIEDLKFLCSLGDVPGEVLEGALLVLFYGLDATCSKMRNSILKDKTFLLTLGSALCTINTVLSKKSKKHQPTPVELTFITSSQLLCCQLIKDVVFADEAKENTSAIAASVVSILGSTLAAEKNIPEKSKKEILAFVFEALLGCSQIEVLRVAFADDLVDSSLSTIDILLDLCQEHNWMVSNGLAVLMNLTIKDLPGLDIRRIVCDAGATDLCLSILSQSGKYGSDDVTNYSFVRAAGLMARLSVLSDVQETLKSATVYQVMCQRLIKNVLLEANDDEPWIVDERNQLIRVVASVRDISAQGKEIGYSLNLPQVLISLLPTPRLELNQVTPTSVILPPLEPLNGMLLGNVALSLLPYADDASRLADIYMGKSLGVERLVCTMATCQDIRVRKNIAILLAKGCRDPEIKKKIEHFRGLQMIVELQKHLI